MSQTKSIGYHHELFVLPFDHRGTFEKKLLGIEGRKPNASEIDSIKRFKTIIYQGYLKALDLGVSKNNSAILVDEQYGSAILEDARKRGLLFACTVEKSGQDEFDFEYGTDFSSHIVKFRPTFAKVLVRFNPENSNELNARQIERLKRLADDCHTHSIRLMLELLVPATQTQLQNVNSDVPRFDRELRPKLMVEAMRLLQESGVEADLWKLEGEETREDCMMIAAQASVGGPHRSKVGVILLGRGENSERVKHWLKTGATVPGMIGFAVGRTVFWESLKSYHAGKISSDEASLQIAQTFKEFCELWKASKSGHTV